MSWVFRFNPDLIRRWLVVGALAGWFALIGPGLSRANGGTILLVKQVGAYDFTVTGSPYPLQVGPNDISVLLGRLSDSQIVLDAQVTLIAQSLEPPGEPQIFPATHDNATNKLYYAANVVFPTPGRWKLTIEVDGPEGPASASFEAPVLAQQTWGLLRYLILGFPVVVVLIFFILRRSSGATAREERAEEER